MNKFLLINPTLNYDDFSENVKQITLEDFDFKTEKPIKNVTYYINDDKVRGYYIEFNQKGKITKLDDFIKNVTEIYEYSDEKTVIKKYLKRENDRISSIDSISYDSNLNITKKCKTIIDEQKQTIAKYVEDFEFDNKNRLLKKYQYYYDAKINKRNFYLKLACEYEYKTNKILEKRISLLKPFTNSESIKKDSSLFNEYLEKIYYLNLKDKVVKIEGKLKDKINQTTNIKYDSSDRIISMTHDLKSWNTYYKYDKKDIVEISNSESNSILKYDSYGNVIYVKGLFSYDPITTFKLTYDAQKNWTKCVSSNNDSYVYKIIREINYY